jgi:hypothetical protein
MSIGKVFPVFATLVAAFVLVESFCPNLFDEAAAAPPGCTASTPCAECTWRYRYVEATLAGPVAVLPPGTSGTLHGVWFTGGGYPSAVIAEHASESPIAAFRSTENVSTFHELNVSFSDGLRVSLDGGQPGAVARLTFLFR